MNSPETTQHLRMLEALLFAATEPLDEASLAARLPDGADVPALLAALREAYANRGVNLVQVAGKWQLRTAEDLAYLLREEREQPRRLSRAALETLAIIAYHQPVTRAEIEEVRGVGLSKGTLDMLLELGWVKLRGRRRVPGRPVTYGVTDAFLEHFGLDSVADLPGLDDLKAAGLLESTPSSAMLQRLRALEGTEEDPLEDGDPGHGEPEDDEPSRTQGAEIHEFRPPN